MGSHQVVENGNQPSRLQAVRDQTSAHACHGVVSSPTTLTPEDGRWLESPEPETVATTAPTAGRRLRRPLGVAMDGLEAVRR